MAKAPAVSVVIATYNRAKLIGETLQSILAQDFQDFELIIIDDGSSDNTREVIAPYRSRVQYVYQPNRGPSAARNRGVALAAGNWISIQDSDDLAAPDHLSVLYDCVRRRPDCAMVFANGAYLAGPEHNRRTIIPPAKSRRLSESGVGLRDLFDKSLVRLQAALIATRAYRELGGHDESLRICMDLDLSFRLIMKFPVAYLDRVVFFYRKHEDNIGRNEELRLSENIRVIERLIRDYPQAVQMLGERSIAGRLAYRYYRLAKGRWQRRETASARAALAEAVRLRPANLKYRLFQLRWARA